MSKSIRSHVTFNGAAIKFIAHKIKHKEYIRVVGDLVLRLLDTVFMFCCNSSRGTVLLFFLNHI